MSAKLSPNATFGTEASDWKANWEEELLCVAQMPRKQILTQDKFRPAWISHPGITSRIHPMANTYANDCLFCHKVLNTTMWRLFGESGELKKQICLCTAIACELGVLGKHE